MKICIVGAGPSGIYLGKYLSSRNCMVDIFEKESQPFGLKRTSFSPEIKRNLNLKPNENMRIFYNSEMNPEILKTKNCDCYVLAIGGVERRLHIPGAEFIIPSSKIVTDYKPMNGDICIIGMGNVAMDIIRNITGYKSIHVINRNNVFNSTFSNSELAKVAKMGINVYTSLIDKIFSFFRFFIPRKYRRRYELLNDGTGSDRLNKGVKNNADAKKYQGGVNLYFSTYPITIKMNNQGKLRLKTNKFEKDFDHIISAIGYEKPDMSQYKSFNKPLFLVGWAKLGCGNLTDIYFDSINTGKVILNSLKKEIKLGT
ncbi:NADPH:adrenodoxin oxidoreductase, mitochondrial [Dictyocoela roeselum]|nr:NADPH:adrenodoxin oxidoreductase, mitochondrial [Dictyocoela roeselum]